MSNDVRDYHWAMDKELLKYLASLLLFGTNGVIASKIAIDSSQIVLGRIVLGLAFMGTVAIATRARDGATAKPGAKNLVLLALSGASLGAGWLFLFAAFGRIGVGLSMLIYYCGSVLVMALSPLFFGEKITAGKACCFGLVLVGACLVNGSSVASGADPLGVGFACIAALSYAGLIILGKKAQGICGAKRGAIQMAGALAAALTIMAFKGGPAFSIPPSNIGWMLLLGLVNTGFGCLIYFNAVSRLDSQKVAVCGYLEPLSSVAFSAVFLHEALGALQMIGGALIIAGAVAFELAGRKAPTCPSLRKRCRNRRQHAL
ncbi:MAG: DMT family transporter [Eggerthellaceae bacterium]